MPSSPKTATVGFDDELWELIETEAAHAGVSVSHYVRDAVIARIVVGPTDPRVFEMFAAAVRDAMRDETDVSKRRGAERSLSVLARLSAVRRQSEARAVRAQSAQIRRTSDKLRDERPNAADQPDPPAGARSVFRISSDWTDIRVVDSRLATGDPDAPQVSWLQEEDVHPDDRKRVHKAVARATKRRNIVELAYRVQLGATVRYAYLRALPLLNSAGTITEWVAVVTDITDDASAQSC
jgi:PAS domain-containing protein